MDRKLNRIKTALVDNGKTNKWLAEQLGKDPATVSKWCTNAAQPSLETLMQIAKLLEVQVDDLLRFEELPEIAEVREQN
jgi:transcriptional regulator with XRE-family HTH domain